MSGQGPYFGQRVWYTTFHQEKLPSVVERYSNEIKRVIWCHRRTPRRARHGLSGGEIVLPSPTSCSCHTSRAWLPLSTQSWTHLGGRTMWLGWNEFHQGQLLRGFLNR